MMSPVWGAALWRLCNYTCLPSLRMLEVGISCLSSPHVQSVSHASLDTFLSSRELEKTDDSSSPLFPGNSILLPHVQSLALLPFLTISFKLSHSWWRPSSTRSPLLSSCSLAVTLPPPPSPPSPHSCTELWAMSVASLWRCKEQPASCSSPAIGCWAEQGISGVFTAFY